MPISTKLAVGVVYAVGGYLYITFCDKALGVLLKKIVRVS